MKKTILVLTIFCALSSYAMKNGDDRPVTALSMADIKSREKPNIFVRFIQFLRGEKVLKPNQQRTQQFRPNPYEW